MMTTVNVFIIFNRPR